MRFIQRPTTKFHLSHETNGVRSPYRSISRAKNSLEGPSLVPDLLTPCSACAVGASAIYAPTHALAPDSVQATRRTITRVNPRHIIQRAGDKIDTVSTLKRGWACSFIQFPDGRRQIVSFLLPGDPIGVESVYFGTFTATHSVQVLTHALVCAFDSADMLKLMGSAEEGLPYFARYLVKHRLQAERRLASIGRKRAIGRIAELLLELQDIAAERNLLRDGALDFPLRQEHVADALGLTPSHVNRTMLTLRRTGIIDVGRGRLRVLDVNQLKLIAENN